MKKYFRIAFPLLISLLITTNVLADDLYEEISYEDIVSRLARKTKASTPLMTSALDEISIHAGLGLIGAANGIKLSDHSTIATQYGFQLSFGIDLFSPEWAAEAALRNFGISQSGSESRSLKETDLKVMHRNLLSDRTGYRIGAGLATRYLKVRDDLNTQNINDTTPAWLFFGGMDSYLSKHLSLGFEAGLRTPMIATTSDKTSFDLMLRLDTYF
jgi:hypothetical protein